MLSNQALAGAVRDRAYVASETRETPETRGAHVALRASSSSFSAFLSSMALLSAAVVGVGGVCEEARGDYVLSAVSSAPVVDIRVGETFDVSVFVSGPASQRFNSCIFSILVTAPGLEIRSYSWDAPFLTDSVYEYSTPGTASLPALIDADLFEKPQAPELNDIEFSNVVDPDSGVSTAGMGRLLTATFAVPADYRGDTRVFLFALPETFANGFDEVTTTIGAGVELRIEIPAPGFAVLGGLALLSTRRRRTARV